MSTSLCFNCASTGNKDNARWHMRYPTSPPKKTLSTAPPLKLDRLRVNNLIENITEKMANKLLTKIIQKCFNGPKETIHFITKHATTDELEEIDKLIVKEQAKSRKYNEKRILFDENQFDKIPTDCMQHIIGYLDKSDIISSKLVSRKMALYCVEEMRKISVSVINGNATLNQINMAPTSLSSFRSITRYHPQKTLKSLQRDWSIKSEIPSDECLIMTQWQRYILSCWNQRQLNRDITIYQFLDYQMKNIRTRLSIFGSG